MFWTAWTSPLSCVLTNQSPVRWDRFGDIPTEPRNLFLFCDVCVTDAICNFLRQGRRSNPWSGLKSVVDSQTVWHDSGTARRHSAKHDCDTLELVCNVRSLLPQVISLQIACTLQTVENDVWWRHLGRMTRLSPTFAHSLTMTVWHTSSWKVWAFNDVIVLDRCRRGSPHGDQLQRQSVQSDPSLLGLAGSAPVLVPSESALAPVIDFFFWWVLQPVDGWSQCTARWLGRMVLDIHVVHQIRGSKRWRKFQSRG